MAGLALAFYTIYAEKLLNKYASILVVGWAMIISGIIMTLRHPIWNVSMTQWHVSTFLLNIWNYWRHCSSIYLFIDSLKYLSAKETTLFGTIEPVVAVGSKWFISRCII